MGAYLPERIGTDFLANDDKCKIPTWVYEYFGETAPATYEYYTNADMTYSVPAAPQLHKHNEPCFCTVNITPVASVSGYEWNGEDEGDTLSETFDKGILNLSIKAMNACSISAASTMNGADISGLPIGTYSCKIGINNTLYQRVIHIQDRTVITID